MVSKLHRNKMKKYISFILSVAFLLNTGGIYLWLKVLQYHYQCEIRQEISMGIQNKDLCLITITNSNLHALQWIKPGKEFRYKGEMYDVVQAKSDKHEQQYYCIHDFKENKLLTQINKTRRNKRDSEKRLKRVFSPQFILQQAKGLNKPDDSGFSYPTLAILFRAAFTHTVSPPPRLA